MNLSIIAAEIARRIPEMAKDSVTNNEGVVLRLMQDEIKRAEQPPICKCQSPFPHPIGCCLNCGGILK